MMELSFVAKIIMAWLSITVMSFFSVILFAGIVDITSHIMEGIEEIKRIYERIQKEDK